MLCFRTSSVSVRYDNPSRVLPVLAQPCIRKSHNPYRSLNSYREIVQIRLQSPQHRVSN